MDESFNNFLALPEQDRKEVFRAVADRFIIPPKYIEKDFWVCWVLDVLYNKLPEGHPQLLFKGGTSLSKAFGLIERFSEDIDIVVDREWLGFPADSDPTIPGDLSNKKRRVLFDKLKTACGDYIRGPFAEALGFVLGETCQIVPDEKDPDQQTLLIGYPSLYPNAEWDYVQPVVKLEAGARSAFEPNVTAKVAAYIAEEFKGTDGDWSFEAGNLRVIEPSRTYLDKLLILHGLHCGYRDEKRLPRDASRLSRHYYDVAMIVGTEVGKAATNDEGLLHSVREHSQIAFRQAWKRLDKAVPGSIRLVPQDELSRVIEKDYEAMQGMMLGEAPKFDWVMEQVQVAEDAINRP